MMSMMIPNIGKISDEASTIMHPLIYFVPWNCIHSTLCIVCIQHNISMYSGTDVYILYLCTSESPVTGGQASQNNSPHMKRFVSDCHHYYCVSEFVFNMAINLYVSGQTLCRVKAVFGLLHRCNKSRLLLSYTLFLYQVRYPYCV